MRQVFVAFPFPITVAFEAEIREISQSCTTCCVLGGSFIDRYLLQDYQDTLLSQELFQAAMVMCFDKVVVIDNPDEDIQLLQEIFKGAQAVFPGCPKMAHREIARILNTLHHDTHAVGV